MRDHYLHAGIRREPTSRVQRYFYPNMASTMSWKLCFRLSGTPSERDVDNVPRATPRKLRLPMLGVAPEPGTYSCQGTTFLDVRCTTSSMLEEDSRYPRNALGTQTATYWLPHTWEHPSALLRASAPEDAHYVLTVHRSYRETAMPRGLKAIC
jgi:hypothetical protein